MDKEILKKIEDQRFKILQMNDRITALERMHKRNDDGDIETLKPGSFDIEYPYKFTKENHPVTGKEKPMKDNIFNKFVKGFRKK